MNSQSSILLKKGIGNVYIMVIAFVWAYSDCKESETSENYKIENILTEKRKYVLE